MPIGWLYITYHLLREPFETAIDYGYVSGVAGSNCEVYFAWGDRMYHLYGPMSCGSAPGGHRVPTKLLGGFVLDMEDMGVSLWR